MTAVRPRVFFRALAKEAWKDGIDDVAAMMTYYAVFALFPMMIFVVTIALLFLPSSTIDSAVAMGASALPGDIAGVLQEQTARMEESAGAGFAVGSFLFTLWAASRGASALMLALNNLFDKRETRSWVRRQLIAIGTTVAVSVLLIVAMALLTAGPEIGHAFAENVGLGAAFDWGWNLARWPMVALLVMLVWALLYKLLPDTDAPFRVFTPGAAVGVALWFLITQGFGLYLDRFGDYEATYGTLAVIVVFLTWLWLSNLTLLIGAEINDVLAELRKDRSPAAAKLAEQEKAPTEKAVPPGVHAT